jgi:hypothetical protein
MKSTIELISVLFVENIIKLLSLKLNRTSITLGLNFGVVSIDSNSTLLTTTSNAAVFLCKISLTSTTLKIVFAE